MAQVIVEDIDPAIMEKLEARAHQYGRSLQAELKAILEQAAHSDAAAHLLDEAHELLAPDLLLPEFGNILWKKVRLEQISLEQGRQILKDFQAVALQIYASASMSSTFFRAYQLDRLERLSQSTTRYGAFQVVKPLQDEGISASRLLVEEPR